MNCPGSPALIAELKLGPEEDEPEYRRDGTAAHAGLAICMEGDKDAWEIAGDKMENGVVVDAGMAEAIQVFINFARPIKQRASAVYIEHGMARPDLHPLFYGTVDFGAVWSEYNLAPPLTPPENFAELPPDIRKRVADHMLDRPFIETLVLDVVDFKYGEGIMVEAPWNPQFMYYAYGILKLHPLVQKVRLTVIQPRMPWHAEGVVRTWEIDAETVIRWAEGTLRPAMIRTDTDPGLNPGDWCRFCPAKLVCPAMKALFGAATTADVREVVEWDDASAARNYDLIPAVKHYLRALEADAFRRLSHGSKFPNWKLVQKKANRVFKPEARDIFIGKFGNKALTEPELLSPAQMEKLGHGAQELVHEYAFTPETGMTIAPADDARAAVAVKTLSERFPAQE